MSKKFILLLVGAMAFNCCNGVLASEDVVEEEEEVVEEFGTGLAEMTDEEWDTFNATLPKIVGIKPNEIALSRVESTEEAQTMTLLEDEEAEIEAAPIGEEMLYSYPNQSSGAAGVYNPEFPLTSAVDVSQSLTFPPIGNQGTYNSCVAWSLGYYQLTNNNCVVKGLNAKTESGSRINENIMSPRFIYTLVNQGNNVPTYFADNCAAILNFGCANASDFSTSITTLNLVKWCSDYDVWKNALYNKPKQIVFGKVESNTSEPVNANTPGIIEIKKILSNGYVVTVGTDYWGFRYTNQTSTGEYACKYLSNTPEYIGHALTIVGYDDNFWVDINNNGKQNEGELGAFKIANSMGTSVANHNRGYFWMAYDAIGKVSGVRGNPASYRDEDPIFTDYYFVEPQKNYTPLLIANVEITTNDRTQVGVEFGVSEANEVSPTHYIKAVEDRPIAFNIEANNELYYDGKVIPLARNFSGEVEDETITVPFDLTPLIKKAYGETGLKAGSELKLYVYLSDNIDNLSSVTLGNVSIAEPITEKSIVSSDNTNLTVNNNSAEKIVDFKITPFVGFYEKQDITLVFNNNVQAESVAENISMLKPDEVTVYPKYKVVDNNIIVYSPNLEGFTEYETDVEYELNLSNAIKSAGGNSLKDNQKILLYFLGDYQEIY